MRASLRINSNVWFHCRPQLTIVTAISGIVLVTCIVVFVSDVALV